MLFGACYGEHSPFEIKKICIGCTKNCRPRFVRAVVHRRGVDLYQRIVFLQERQHQSVEPTRPDSLPRASDTLLVGPENDLNVEAFKSAVLDLCRGTSFVVLHPHQMLMMKVIATDINERLWLDKIYVDLEVTAPTQPSELTNGGHAARQDMRLCVYQQVSSNSGDDETTQEGSVFRLVAVSEPRDFVSTPDCKRNWTGFKFSWVSLDSLHPVAEDIRGH